MIKKHWRDVLEVAAVLSVVGGLLMVAFEVRQANRIASAQTVMQLSSAYNEINSARFENAEVARLVLLLQYPEDYDASEIDGSRMVGLAYHLLNIMWAAQNAYENGLLSLDDLTNYRNDLEGLFEDWPGLVTILVAIYESQPDKYDGYVFEPLARLAADVRAGPASVR